MNMSDMSPEQAADLERLDNHIQTEIATKFDENTKRTLGVVIVIALSAIAGGVLALFAIVSNTASDQKFSDLVDSMQPGTIVVAVIAALGGLAAGIGLKDR